MSKRHKSVITAMLLSAGLAGITFLENEDRIIAIILLSVITLVLFFWTLHDRLEKNATVMVLVLPPLFTLGTGLFWFLLPANIYTRLPGITLYGVSLYVMALMSNILLVSVHKKIPLARAAKAVAFVFTLFVPFLLYDAVLSLKAGIAVNTLLVFSASFPIIMQALWTSKLTRGIDREIIIYSAVFSLQIAFGALMLYFWPVTLVVGSLLLTLGIYTLVGLGQSKLEGRLFKRTAYEYIIAGSLIFIIVFFFTSWRG